MADIEKMKPIKTKHGLLEIYRDWDSEGAIYMKNAQTIKRYKELSDEHPNPEDDGMFWAFNTKQYEEGKVKMKELGFYKEGQTIYSIGSGGYGTSIELIDKFLDFYINRRKRVAEECDPQEVYLYEYNNHECMIGWEGDEPAYKIIVDTFGEKVAKSITRFSVSN